VPTARPGPIRWGIFGAGKIAHVFARDFVHVQDGRLAAFASRETGATSQSRRSLLPRGSILCPSSPGQSHGNRSHVMRWAREYLWTLGQSWVHGMRTTRVYAHLIGHGLHDQVGEVNPCPREERSESSIMPWHESLLVMQTMDRIRAQFERRDVPPFLRP